MQLYNRFLRGIKNIYHKEDFVGKIILICFSLFVIICLCSVPLIIFSPKSSTITTIAKKSSTIPTFTVIYPIVPTITEVTTPTLLTIIPTEELTETEQFSLNSSTTPSPLLISLTPSLSFYQSYTLTIIPNNNVTPTQTLASSPLSHSGCIIQGDFPDPTCTPGAIFNVTKDQICVSGYSSSVRNVSETEKEQVYAEYRVTSHTTGQYEIDHFIPLELGGSNDIINLWPEAASPVPGFHQKDEVENYLHEKVCSGAISLTEAQSLIQTNWLAVYSSMGTTLNTPMPTYSQAQLTETQPAVSTLTQVAAATQTAPGHPVGTNGLCGDGTYTSAQHKQGACSYHGGVQQWWGP